MSHRRSGGLTTSGYRKQQGQQYKLFVKNLPPSVDDRQLKSLVRDALGAAVYDRCNPAPYVSVAKDKHTQRSREFGFVNVADQLVANKLVVKLNGKVNIQSVFSFWLKCFQRVGEQNLVVCFSFESGGRSGGYPTPSERMFDLIDAEKRKLLQFDDVSEYSVTPISAAHLMSKMLLTLQESASWGVGADAEQFASQSSIVDGTTCVGGNTISFAKFYNHVYSFELNAERYKMLENNVKVLQLENVTTLEGSFLKLFEISTEDEKFGTILDSAEAVFLDPPWGGPDYKKHKTLQLHLDTLSMPEICQKILKKFTKIKMVCLKLPNNFDFASLVSSEMFHVLCTRFNNLSIVFMMPVSVISFEEFQQRIKKLPLKPADAIWCQIWKPDSTSWTTTFPDSLTAFLN
jgi:hypothetical protein